MFFTRDVKHRIQQDTYIQRARMFGSRGKYLEHFELTIPEHLYADWHRCFVFHRLALAAIQKKLGSPVWLTDRRIAAVASSSIDQSTVDVNRGEMAFHLFDHDGRYDDIVSGSDSILQKLERLAALGSGVFPGYLKEFMVRTSPNPADEIALHSAGPVANYADMTPEERRRIERKKGLMATSALEKGRYPNARHHIKAFFNDHGKARLLYKYLGSIQFSQNMRRS